MSYTRPTFTVQGVTFKLKPTSPRNVQQLMSFVKDSDIQSDEDDTGMATLAKQYETVLSLIADPEDGSMDDIDPMEIDINQIDHYLQDFLPVGTAT